MADVKISALPAASTPLTGGEVLPIVQSSTTKQVAVSNLTAGLSGTASININGTVGATTATTGAFTSGTFSTTLGVTGTATFGTSQNSSSFVNITNTNAGASADARIDLTTHATLSALTIQAYGSGASGTLFGASIANLKAVFDNSSAAQSSGMVIGTTAALPLILGTNNAARLTIDSVGAVTIPGTLGVSGVITASSGVSASALVGDSTNAGGTALNLKNSGTTKTLLGGWSSIIGSGSANDTVLQAAGQLGLYSGATQGILINGAAVTIPGTLGVTGDAGIGTTTTPAGSSAASRFITVAGTGDGVVQLTRTSATTGGGAIASAAGPGLIFYTHTGTVGSETYLERCRITSGGDLYVGTTTGTVGTANFGAVVTTTGSIFASRNEDGSVVVFYTGGNAGAFRVLGNGNAQNTNNSYGAISDVKLKENIVDASPKLADLMQVKVRNYNLIGDTTKQIGVVAQELETIFPSMIDATLDKNAEGNDLGTTTKSVKYSVFVPMLIKAMQEQQAIITALTTRITALTTRIAALEAK